MTLRLWLLLSLTWIVIVGGASLATHWVQTGDIGVPNYDRVVFDDAEMSHSDFSLYSHQAPRTEICNEYHRESSDRTHFDNCLSIQSGEAYRWRVAFAQFLGIVFGPPMLLGLGAIIWRIVRG